MLWYGGAVEQGKSLPIRRHIPQADAACVRQLHQDMREPLAGGDALFLQRPWGRQRENHGAVFWTPHSLES